MSVHVHITVEDIRQIAWTMVDLHGAEAIGYADEAMTDCNTNGQPEGAEAWRALRSVMEDALAGRLAREGAITLH
ncbi:hypothetical protein [Maricaulis sp. CAU 1757]